MAIFGFVDVNVMYLDTHECLGIHSDGVLTRRKAGECEDTFLIRGNAPLRRLFVLKQQFDLTSESGMNDSSMTVPLNELAVKHRVTVKARTNPTCIGTDKATPQRPLRHADKGRRFRILSSE